MGELMTAHRVGRCVAALCNSGWVRRCSYGGGLLVRERLAVR